MAERFFVAQIESGGSLRLTGDQAHHLVHVCRIGCGGRVRLFDGSGAEWAAMVEQIGKREVLLSVSGRELVDRELPFGLTLACAPPKGDRLRWLVEKATELGITRFVPLQTERTSVHVRGVKPDKLRRWVIEASKQCGRNLLMQVTEPVPWPSFVDSVDASTIRIVAHPDEERPASAQQRHPPSPLPLSPRGGGRGVAAPTAITLVAPQSPMQGEGYEIPQHFEENHPLPPLRGETVGGADLGADPCPHVAARTDAESHDSLERGVAIAIGPEGGFTDAEVDQARDQGWVVTGLGPRTLRIETAALAAVARLTVNLPAAALSNRIPSPSR